MKPKILVVEDEVIIAMQIKSILEDEGYEAIINIYSVEAAIHHIELDPPILVLIDINLNKNKDGVDLGRYLQERKEIPFIYITSYSNKTTLDRVNETRPDGYIVKPFKPCDIISTIYITLNKHKHKKIDIVIESSNEKFDHVPFKLKTIINYINQNINDRIEIQDLVALTDWKERHFSRLFLEYLQVTPYQYILTRKIEKAATQIEETRLPIKDIAFDFGFNSYSNFCNAFKKIKGENPENYRRKKLK